MYGHPISVQYMRKTILIGFISHIHKVNVHSNLSSGGMMSKKTDKNIFLSGSSVYLKKKCETGECLPDVHTVKTCVKWPLSKGRKLVFKTNYRLMQVKSIAECSEGSILQYYRPALSYHLSLRSMFCLF